MWPPGLRVSFHKALAEEVKALNKIKIINYYHSAGVFKTPGVTDKNE